MCFTHSFEGFRQVFVGCSGDSIAGGRRLGFVICGGFLRVVRLSCRRNLLLVPFLSNLIEAIIQRL